MIDWLQPVISNLMVASLLGGLAWLAGRRGKRAPLAHLLWVAFFVKLMTPPILLLPISVPESWIPSRSFARGSDHVPTYAESPETSIRPETASATDSPVLTARQDSTVFQGSLTDPWILIVCLWIGGVFFLLSRGLIRFLRFRRLLRREGIHDEAATEFVAELVNTHSKSRISRLRRTPPVLRIPIRISPMLFGFGHRPVIVCPDQLWKTLTESERRSFLAHESAHYCRRDHWVRWLEWFVAAVYWWFPGVYLARRQLERHEEACCDAWAVKVLNTSPREYADALLRVIDFISEHQVRVPRFASGMRPTDMLEERLRAVMQLRTQPEAFPRWQYSFVIISIVLLILHPIPQPIAEAIAKSPSDLSSFNHALDRLPSSATVEFPTLENDPIDLPPLPQGYWNRKPRPEWAEFSLALPGATLTADVRRGIEIEIEEGKSLYYSPDEMRAIVEIPSTQRVVIGSRDGSVRVWDLIAGVPVSLLGRHANEITSIAYHEHYGLISSDSAGTVIRWDLQSGQMQATFSLPDVRIQSIRFSKDGTSLAILTGSWNDPHSEQSVYFVEGESLNPAREVRLTQNTALVLASRGQGWLAIDWSGAVRMMESGQSIGQVSKPLVSAMLLSQEVSLPEFANSREHLYEEIP